MGRATNPAAANKRRAHNEYQSQGNLGAKHGERNLCIVSFARLWAYLFYATYVDTLRVSRFHYRDEIYRCSGRVDHYRERDSPSDGRTQGRRKNDVAPGCVEQRFRVSKNQAFLSEPGTAERSRCAADDEYL